MGMYFLLTLVYCLIEFQSCQSSQCSSQTSCDTCVGTFKDADNCIWCSDEGGKCMSSQDADKDTDDGGCATQYQEQSCQVSYYTVVFVIILVVFLSLCCGFVIARKCRGSGDDGLDEPLLSDSARSIFERISTSGGKPWMCIICGYDNKPRAKHCPMCGTSHEFSDEYKLQKSERERTLRRRKQREVAKQRQQRLEARLRKETHGSCSTSHDVGGVSNIHTMGSVDDTTSRSQSQFPSQSQSQSHMYDMESGEYLKSAQSSHNGTNIYNHSLSQSQSHVISITNTARCGVSDGGVEGNNIDRDEDPNSPTLLDNDTSFERLIVDGGALWETDDGDGRNEKEDDGPIITVRGCVMVTDRSSQSTTTTAPLHDRKNYYANNDDTIIGAHDNETENDYDNDNDNDNSRLSMSVMSQSDRFEAFNYRRLNTLSLRQKVARRRKMWQRVVSEETGELTWIRKAVKETTIGTSPFGFTPRPSEQNTPMKGNNKTNTSEVNTSLIEGIRRLLGSPSRSRGNGTGAGISQEEWRDGRLSYSSSDPDVVAAFNNTLFENSHNLSTPRDSFDHGVGSQSPGFTSVFTEEGSIRWEQVESGMPAVAGTDVHIRQGVQNHNKDENVTRPTHTMPFFSTGAIGSARSNRLSGTVSSIPSSLEESQRAHELMEVADLQSAAMLPFKEKQFWFLNHMSDIQKPWSDGCIRIEVSRTNILHETFAQFSRLEKKVLHRYMRIQFAGEPGIDAGGLEREWFGLTTQALLDPEFGLFTCSADGPMAGTYHISPLSGHPNACKVASSHLKWFHFAGRFFAKAIMEQQSLNVTISLPLRKQILALPIMFSDLEFVDADIYKNLEWLKQNKGAEVLYLDFTIAYEANNIIQKYELKPNGSNIMVTDDNKNEFLYLSLKHRMLDSIKPQLEHFLKGFYEVLPSDLLSVFDYQELELLMCGLPEIDLEDWMRNTEYLGDYKRLGPKHKVIRWFWLAVSQMTHEERVKLLQFATGCSRLPVQGFKALQSNDGNYRKFNLQSIGRAISVYPRAHTCFNKIDLPLYKSQEELEAYLSIVVNMEVTGFTMD
jgi:hypothetical protein